MSSSFAKSWISNVLPFLAFAVAYYFDHKLTTIAIYPAYLVSILLATSKWGALGGVSFSIMSGGISSPMSPLLEWKKNAPYLDIFIARSFVLALLSIFYSNYISQLKINKKRVTRLKSVIPQCPDCGALYCRDGQWRSMEQLVSDPEQFGVMPSHDCNSSKQTAKP